MTSGWLTWVRTLGNETLQLQPSNILGDWSVWSVIHSKFHHFSLLKGPATRIHRALVHPQFYALSACDSSDSAILVEGRQGSLHIGRPFPFLSNVELIGGGERRRARNAARDRRRLNVRLSYTSSANGRKPNPQDRNHMQTLRYNLSK